MSWLCANGVGGYGWMGFASGGMMLLFWGGIIALGYYFIKHATIKNESSGALNILRERFAKGEITQAEYEQMKSKL